MKSLKTLLLAVPAALCFSASAQANPTPRADEAPPPTAPFEVKTAWTDSCEKCHGPDGKGLTKIGDKVREKGKTMPDLTAPKTDAAKYVDIITKGVADTMMKPYESKFTKEQIAALADFAKTFKK